MRGHRRSASGQGRNSEPSGVLRFSSEDLPEAHRIEQWREVVGRTLTGCVPSSLEGGELKVDFACVGGESTRIAMNRLWSIRNHRDHACLRDGDDDLVFFSMIGGEGHLDHRDQRTVLRRGEGLLARFDRTLDTSWERADVMLIRLPWQAMRGLDIEAILGSPQRASLPLMRLLQCYTRAAWREARPTGRLAPIAERHIAELVAALCGSQSDEAGSLAGAAAGAARVAAMLEIMRRDYANPCLAMREVASGVGISERAGYLAFEQAGLGFTDELHRVRLERACERLLNGAERVIDVAYAVGFSDGSHFHRLFKTRFGYSPGELRQSAREKFDLTPLAVAWLPGSPRG